MWAEDLWQYIEDESFELLEWAKCGDGAVTALPTLIWAAGEAALANRLLTALFRRFLFRRVPWWELMLQHMLFVWMVLYSVHFWILFVKIIKVLVDYMYNEALISMFEEPTPLPAFPEARCLLQQAAVWACSAVPLAVFIHTRPRSDPPPLMIWITTSPWQRREMGPYGYYLQRPPAPAPPPAPRALRRAFSDSCVAAPPPHKKRCSKSDLCDSYVEWLAKWLSCNGETWGVGPTVVFASAAALFLYHELEATIFEPGDHVHVSLLEKTLISTMVVGMLALMIHIWVCSMRFFQYYLDTLIRDSPNVLLEMTTAGLLGGGQSEIMALGPLTRFLRQQQPQIHITVCWFLSLCYADYVRKHYCTRFNLPYLEQWQTQLQSRAERHVRRILAEATSLVGDVHQRLRRFSPAPDTVAVYWAGAYTQAELHARAARRVRSTVDKVNSFVGGVHQRLRGFAPRPDTNEAHTGTNKSYMDVGGAAGTVPCCDGRARGSAGELSREREMCVRLVGQSSETTADAIEKLRAYIKATRCSCCGPPDSGLCHFGHTTPQETPTL